MLPSQRGSRQPELCIHPALAIGGTFRPSAETLAKVTTGCRPGGDSAAEAFLRGEQNFIYVLAGATMLPWEHPGDPAQTDTAVHKHEVKSSSLGGGSCLDELTFAAL